MKVNVTARHIEEAKCGNPYHCMIAEAIRDSVPNAQYVIVRTNGITITQRRKNGVSVRSRWMVPTKAARAIIRFDAGDSVSPFSFEPTMVDRHELKPRTDLQREMDRINQRKKRTAMKVLSRKEIWRRRIAGI